MRSTFALIWLALALFITWVILRLGLAMAAGMAHLLWVAAMIAIALWIVQETRGRRWPRA